MASSSCVVRTNFDEVWDRPAFETTLAIERMHGKSPRFGHSNDFNLLIEGSKTEQQDYLTGLLAASFALFCFFLSWSFLILIVFKCCLGPSKVGFFSARRILPDKPNKPDCYVNKEDRKKLMCQLVIFQRQQNGQAAAASSSNKCKNKHSRSSKIPNPAKVPTAILSKAREKKRQLEEKRGLRKNFARMKSTGSFTEAEIDEASDSKSKSQSKSTTIPNTFITPSTIGQQTTSTSNSNSNSNSQSSILLDHQDPSVISASASASISASVDNNSIPSTPHADNSIMSSPEQYPNRQQQQQQQHQSLSKEDLQTIEKYESDLKDYRSVMQRHDMRIRRIRILVGFSCIGIVISSILFTVMAMDELSSSVDSAKMGLQQISNVAGNGIDLVNLFQERQIESQESTQKFLIDINEICPEAAPSLCANITSDIDRQCDFSQIPFGEELADLFQFLDSTLDLVFGQLQDLEDDLVELQDLLAMADKYYPQTFAWVFWVAAGACLGLGALCLILLCGILLLAYKGELPPYFKWTRSWLVAPLFLLLTFVSWIFSMVFVIGSIGAADMCYDSPDVSMLNILGQLEDNFTSLVYVFLVYYVQGCPVVDAPKDLEQKIALVVQLVLPALQRVAAAISTTGEENLDELCGTSLLPFVAIIGALEDQLCILSQTLAELRLLFSCRNWYPIYEETVRNAICYDLTNGLSWAASTQFVIIFLALLILTLRVAYYETGEVLDDGVKGCCGCYTSRSSTNKHGELTDEDDEKDNS